MRKAVAGLVALVAASCADIALEQAVRQNDVAQQCVDDNLCRAFLCSQMTINKLNPDNPAHRQELIRAYSVISRYYFEKRDYENYRITEQKLASLR